MAYRKVPAFHAAVAACLLVLTAPMETAHGQEWEEIPHMSFSTSLAGADTMRVTITYCDDRNLNASTRLITLRGQNVTSQFTYQALAPNFMCQGNARSVGTIRLVEGDNPLTASIRDLDNYLGADTVVYPFTARRAPIISLAPHNGDSRRAELCAFDCFEVISAYSTPAYVSMDTPRSVTLLYRSGTGAPRGFVEADVTDSSFTTADYLSLKLMRVSGGSPGSLVDFISGGNEIFFRREPGGRRLAAQFDASALATGAHQFTLIVTNHWNSPAASHSTSIPVTVLVQNESASELGAGWMIAGLQRLHLSQSDGSIVVTEGDGSILHFRQSPPPGDFTTLTTRPEPDSIRYERRYPDGTVLEFLPTGRLRHATDRYGNRVTYGYDAGQRLVSVTDPVGQSIALSYDATSGKLAWIDEHGRRTTVTVNAAGDLSQIVNPAQELTFRGTYSAHRLATVLDLRGGETAYQYDHTGAVAEALSPAFVAEGLPKRLKTVIRSVGAATVPATSGSSGSPAPAPVATDLRGVIIAPGGDSVRVRLDRFGAANWIESTDGVTTITRNTSAQVEQTIAPVEGQTNFTWSRASLTSVTRVATGVTTTMTYNGPFGQVTLVTAPGVSERFYYRTTGPLAGALDSAKSGKDSAATRYAYDLRGRVDSVIDPKGHVTRVFRTGLWENSDSTRVGSLATHRRHDALGRVRETRSPLGVVDSVWYDAMNRQTDHFAPLGFRVGSVADVAAGTVTTTDALGQGYRSTFNALGQVEEDRDPAGRVDRYVYDSLGRVVSWTNRRSQVTRFTYDAQGRVLTRTLADGRVTTFRYPSPAIVVGVAPTSYDSVVTSPQAATRVTRRNGVEFVASIADYPSTGAREFIVRRTDGWSRSNQWWRDSLGRIDRIGPVGPGLTTLSFDGEGSLKSVRYPGNWQASRSTGNHHTVTRWSDRTFATSYAYDSALRVLNKVIETAAQDTILTYRYDLLGRLTGVETGLPQTSCTAPESGTIGPACPEGYVETVGLETRAFDVIGNPAGTGTSVEAGNRLRMFKGYSLEYDADGNLARKVDLQHPTAYDRRYFWNSVNQLDSITDLSTVIARFEYDAFGGRIRKTTLSDDVGYLLQADGVHIAAEITPATGALRRSFNYFPGIDRPHAMQDASGTTRYFLSDGRGNIAAVADGNLLPVSTYRYGTYGTAASVQEAPGVSSPFRFAGREYDVETGLYYNRARYLDPEIERFISEDPIGLDGGINQYAYAGNDPVNFTDPSGLELVVCVPQYTTYDLPDFSSDHGVNTPHIDRITVFSGYSCSGGGMGGLGGNGGTGQTIGPQRPGGGGGGGGIAMRAEFKDRTCALKQLSLALTVAGDLAFFTGLGAGARLLAVGLRYGQSARVMSATARLARTNRASTAMNRQRNAFSLAATSGSTDVGGYLSWQGLQVLVAEEFSSHPPDISLSDFVPGFASWEAWRDVKRACGY